MSSSVRAHASSELPPNIKKRNKDTTIRNVRLYMFLLLLSSGNVRVYSISKTWSFGPGIFTLKFFAHTNAEHIVILINSEERDNGASVGYSFIKTVLSEQGEL
jgi:hypothetical protein